MTTDNPKKERNMIKDLARLNRKIFTTWSFIENRKLLLLWANSVSIFYILSLVSPIYRLYPLILALVFLTIEVGEFLSKKKPKTESDSKDREIHIGRMTIHLKGKNNESK